jgi:4-amino-4-deoxy-L-arabinose transferase-like glycosyltransferase
VTQGASPGPAGTGGTGEAAADGGAGVLLLIVAAALLVVLPSALGRDLWAPDEPRYAQVARETLQDGAWWHPHVNGRPYRDKPPLYFWLAAVASAPFGDVSEATARAPAVAAFLVAVGLTGVLGHRLAGGRAGRVAAAALATAWLSAWMGARVNLDVPLMAAACAVAWALLRAGADPPAWAWGALAGLVTAAGVMTKGPVLFLFVLPVAGVLALHPARTAEERRLVRRALGVAVAALAAGLAVWLVPARLIGGYDPLGIVEEHVVDRAVAGLAHAQPPWYYLATWPGDLFPWSLLAVPALLAAWRNRGWRRPSVAVALAWTLVPLVVLSVVVEKRNIYLVPSLPGWALLVGAHVAAVDRGEAPRRGVALASAAAAGVLAAVGLAAGAVAALGSSLEAVRRLGDTPGLGAALAAVAVAGLAAAWVVARELRRRAGATRLALTVALGMGAVLLAVSALLPRLDATKSARSVGAAVARATFGRPAAFYPGGDASRWAAYVFYSRRTFAETSDADDLAAWLASVTRPAFVLTYDRDVPTVPPDGDAPPAVVVGDAVGHRSPVLLRYDR